MDTDSAISRKPSACHHLNAPFIVEVKGAKEYS
jgi:hypothetical protein